MVDVEVSTDVEIVGDAMMVVLAPGKVTVSGTGTGC